MVALSADQRAAAGQLCALAVAYSPPFVAEAVAEDELPVIACALHAIRAPAELRRLVLRRAWQMVPDGLSRAAGSTAALLGMFRSAAFEVPAHMPEIFPVWRGVVAHSLARARWGLSWSLRRGIAARYAVLQQAMGFPGSPWVLRRMVWRRDVVFFSDVCGEAEVIVDAAPAGDVDGDLLEWGQDAAAEGARLAEWARDLVGLWDRGGGALHDHPLWARDLVRRFLAARS